LSSSPSLPLFPAQEVHFAPAHIALSVVIPVCNEQENVRPLGLEITAVLASLKTSYEIIYVDDGSTDATATNVRDLHADVRQVRLVRHHTRCGQSAAICTGARVARAEWILTLDGDGQNDPADIPAFLAALESDRSGALRMIIGNRVARQDTWLRRISSRIANRIRARLLKDGTPDTGCGIKLFHRQTFLQLPSFRHMHRFLPALTVCAAYIGATHRRRDEVIVPRRRASSAHTAKHHRYRAHSPARRVTRPPVQVTDEMH
jgi:dolichol-phosphate mannosyltransferase